LIFPVYFCIPTGRFLTDMSDLRAYIIDTATNLFLQKGYKEVTMKDLVGNANVSKGAFYHYFTSKEQVFEEVVLNFFGDIKANYDKLSALSLKDFYTGLINSHSGTNQKAKPASKEDKEFNQNHYYLIFDGLRLVPSFKKKFDDQQNKELKAWSKAIDNAKKNGEIKSKMPTRDIAEMFMYLSDGLGINLAFQNKTTNQRREIMKVLDNFYSLLK
jgi:TetR/AcrR family transcriptional regulator, transcriptional repressor for nem operon